MIPLPENVNQSESSPVSQANCSPESETEPEDPITEIDITRPPKSPYPFLWITVSPWSVPTDGKSP